MIFRNIYEIFIKIPEMTTKEPEITITEIERIFYEGMRKIQAPPPRPGEEVIFGRESNNDVRFVTVKNGGYWYGCTDRGTTKHVYHTENSNEVLYYLFRTSTSWFASDNLKKCFTLFRTDKFDQRRLKWKIQLNLLSIINPEFAQKQRKEYEERIMKSPFDDGFPETLTFLDDYPCPLLTPGFCPDSCPCPLDENGEACSLNQP